MVVAEVVYIKLPLRDSEAAVSQRLQRRSYLSTSRTAGGSRISSTLKEVMHVFARALGSFQQTLLSWGRDLAVHSEFQGPKLQKNARAYVGPTLYPPHPLLMLACHHASPQPCTATPTDSGTSTLAFATDNLNALGRIQIWDSGAYKVVGMARIKESLSTSKGGKNPKRTPPNFVRPPCGLPGFRMNRRAW